MTREAYAVRKAGKARLLEDMRRAAVLVSRVQADDDWKQGYVFGWAHASSATVRACLMTAWGK